MLNSIFQELVDAVEDVLENEELSEFSEARLLTAIKPIKNLLGESEETFVQEQEMKVYLYDESSIKFYNKPGNC